MQAKNIKIQAIEISVFKLQVSQRIEKSTKFSMFQSSDETNDAAKNITKSLHISVINHIKMKYLVYFYCFLNYLIAELIITLV